MSPQILPKSHQEDRQNASIYHFGWRMLSWRHRSAQHDDVTDLEAELLHVAVVQLAQLLELALAQLAPVAPEAVVPGLNLIGTIDPDGEGNSKSPMHTPALR